jgi:hypothetical protein
MTYLNDNNHFLHPSIERSCQFACVLSLNFALKCPPSTSPLSTSKSLLRSQEDCFATLLSLQSVHIDDSPWASVFSTSQSNVSTIFLTTFSSKTKRVLPSLLFSTNIPTDKTDSLSRVNKSKSSYGRVQTAELN